MLRYVDEMNIKNTPAACSCAYIPLLTHFLIKFNQPIQRFFYFCIVVLQHQETEIALRPEIWGEIGQNLNPKL